jgi:hypothetical protein
VRTKQTIERQNILLAYISTILLPPPSDSTNTFDGALATISGFGKFSDSNSMPAKTIFREKINGFAFIVS